MESVAESETMKFEIGTVLDEREDFVKTEVKSRRIYQVPRNTLLYAQFLSGFAVIFALLFVPLITLPGLFILVLVAEVYLLDWTHSKVSQIRETKSFISKEAAEKSPEDEIDRKVVRSSPKNQFVR
ncbi:MAG: hypothetical protein ACFFEE_03710 [Candidatus Thorarchaeota archaeon]